jgi:hypothetical protein
MLEVNDAHQPFEKADRRAGVKKPALKISPVIAGQVFHHL